MPTMDDQDCSEPASVILSRARQAGFSVSDAQLARWHRDGLLPRPSTRSLGRGRGTQTIYPAGTGKQLFDLCRLHRKHRHLGDVTWRLWFLGYPVSERLWHSKLQSWAAELDRSIAEIEQLAYPDGDDFLSDEALDAIESAASRRFASEQLLQARKRVGRKNFPTLLRLVIELATGRFSGSPAGDGDGDEERQLDMAILERSFGFQRARTDRIGSVGPWLQGDITPTLAEVADLLQQMKFTSILKTTSAADLAQAREELSGLLSMMIDCSSVLEAMFGRHAFGYGVFARLVETGSARNLGWMLIVWCAFRRVPKFANGMRELLRLPPAVRMLSENYRKITLLRTEVPAFAAALSDRTLSTTLRSARKAQSHHVELARIGNAHKDEVTAFLSRHPEVESQHEE